MLSKFTISDVFFWGPVVAEEFLKVVVLVYFTSNLFNLEEETMINSGNNSDPIYTRFQSVLLQALCRANLAAQDFRWLEFFAGHAACTFEMRQAGFRSARFDKLYCQDPGAHGRKTNWMDLTTPSGFAFPSCNLTCIQIRCACMYVKKTQQF